LGFEECAALCAANNEIAPLHLRVNTQRTELDKVLESLHARGLDARAGKLSSDAIIVKRGEVSLGSPVDWPEWKEGSIIAQDEAAQLVGRLANPREGWTIIDACAAPGGKSTHLAQLMKDEGNVIACDLAPGRLKLVRENAERLGLGSIETKAGDIREIIDELPQADLVLLDAPCLGTGTWRRRPDARWRKTKSQLRELAMLQNELLEAAAQKVKRGGFLVYSTCSLEIEENETQVHTFLQRQPDWKVATDLEAALQAVATPEGFLQTWPHRNGCDGMFAAKLQRAG
jgi:16S rRNA (cytosine967-C5)-methyltransferase